jgi:hypothetical protein
MDFGRKPSMIVSLWINLPCRQFLFFTEASESATPFLRDQAMSTVSFGALNTVAAVINGTQPIERAVRFVCQLGKPIARRQLALPR